MVRKRLAAQVPPPRAHQVRYHGILAPSAQWRPYVVPAGDAHREVCSHRGVQRLQRRAWSDLLRRVFAVDALECNRCGGRMRVLVATERRRALAVLIPALAGRPPPEREHADRATESAVDSA